METLAKYKPNLEVVSDPETLAHRSVELFVAAAEKAIETKNVFYAAISGGHTPRRFFELLGDVPRARDLTWEKIRLFWVDERYVPPDSEWSNYKLAADTFLSKVGIPEENVHRIPTDQSDFRAAARSYEATIREAFGLEEKEIPAFDLIVLGMGVEGHLLVPCIQRCGGRFSDLIRRRLQSQIDAKRQDAPLEDGQLVTS